MLRNLIMAVMMVVIFNNLYINHNKTECKIATFFLLFYITGLIITLIYTSGDMFHCILLLYPENKIIDFILYGGYTWYENQILMLFSFILFVYLIYNKYKERLNILN